MRRLITGTVLFFLVLTAGSILKIEPAFAENGFTQKDRELLIKLKVKMVEMEKRFEPVDKRISELREDMNKRFE